MKTLNTSRLIRAFLASLVFPMLISALVFLSIWIFMKDEPEASHYAWQASLISLLAFTLGLAFFFLVMTLSTFKYENGILRQGFIFLNHAEISCIKNYTEVKWYAFHFGKVSYEQNKRERVFLIPFPTIEFATAIQSCVVAPE